MNTQTVLLALASQVITSPGSIEFSARGIELMRLDILSDPNVDLVIETKDENGNFWPFSGTLSGFSGTLIWPRIKAASSGSSDWFTDTLRLSWTLSAGASGTFSLSLLGW